MSFACGKFGFATEALKHRNPLCISSVQICGIRGNFLIPEGNKKTLS